MKENVPVVGCFEPLCPHLVPCRARLGGDLVDYSFVIGTICAARDMVAGCLPIVMQGGIVQQIGTETRNNITPVVPLEARAWCVWWPIVARLVALEIRYPLSH